MDLSAIDNLELLGLDSFLFYGEGEGAPPAEPGSDVLDALSDDPPPDPAVPDADLDALIEALGLDAGTFLWAGNTGGPSTGTTQQAGFGLDADLAIAQGATGEPPPEEPFISDIPGVTPVDKPHDPPVENPIIPSNSAVSGGQPQQAAFGFDSQFVIPAGQGGEPLPEEPFISDIPGVTPVDKPHDPPVADPIVPDMLPEADSLLFL